jgi:hypothetical protein
VRRGPITLARYVDVTGTGNSKAMTFEQEVLWVREAGTKLIFIHGGVELKTSSGYADCGYGFLSSLRSVLDDASRNLRRYSVTPDSTLELQVLVSITDKPVLIDNSAEARDWNARSKRIQYQSLPTDWLIYDAEKFAARDAAKTWSERCQIEVHRLEAVPVSETVIWSSKNTPEDNAAKVEAFIAEQRAIAQSLADAHSMA